ncbi:MAG TPA: thioredoxin domain-containing protein [Terriglobales bacterium]|nr:thioredoxin domain-containing protein [Terriglobales bacterium]
MKTLKLAAALLLTLASTFSIAADLEALRPPKGDKVALIVFEDLECPDCARAHPLVIEAARRYNIPLVIHDFPLPMHPWAMDAAVTARYFEAKSPELGREFRSYVFTNQPSLDENPSLFHALAQKFAAAHGVALPFAIDPNGEIRAEIQKDKALGQRVGIEHTPTIYVATNQTAGQPAVEVVDRSQLYQMIEAAQRATANEPGPKSTKKPARTSASARKSQGQ